MIEPRSPASGLAAQRESLAPSIVIIVALVFVGRGKPSPTRWLRRRHANDGIRRVSPVAAHPGEGRLIQEQRSFSLDRGAFPSCPQADPTTIGPMGPAGRPLACCRITGFMGSATSRVPRKCSRLLEDGSPSVSVLRPRAGCADRASTR
jgi:hypothetical protein